jgi:hypothetical protein
MIDVMFRSLKPEMQGLIILLAGFTIFLNALNIIKGLTALVIIIAIVMMWYGTMQAGYDKKIRELFKKK